MTLDEYCILNSEYILKTLDEECVTWNNAFILYGLQAVEHDWYFSTPITTLLSMFNRYKVFDVCSQNVVVHTKRDGSVLLLTQNGGRLSDGNKQYLIHPTYYYSGGTQSSYCGITLFDGDSIKFKLAECKTGLWSNINEEDVLECLPSMFKNYSNVGVNNIHFFVNRFFEENVNSPI